MIHLTFRICLQQARLASFNKPDKEPDREPSSVRSGNE
jgi:hypothetical protein